MSVVVPDDAGGLWGKGGGGCLRDMWWVGYITTILPHQDDVGDFKSPGRDNDHSIPEIGVYRQLMKKKKETGNSRRRRHKSSLSSFWMMASWVVGVCLLRARRSITPRPLRTRPQDGTLKSSHRESSSHHESSQSSSPMPANQNGGVSASASAPSGDASDGAAWDMSKGADE